MASRNWDFVAELGPNSYGVLYTIENNVPDVTIRLSFPEILTFCEAAHENDPFAMVHLQDDQRCWYKGEYCYANGRFKFSRVGLAAVPDMILMMELCKP